MSHQIGKKLRTKFKFALLDKKKFLLDTLLSQKPKPLDYLSNPVPSRKCCQDFQPNENKNLMQGTLICKKSHRSGDKPSKLNCWNLVEALISARKSTFDRYEFAITEESVDYTSKFRELAKYGDLEKKEGVLSRDLFSTNLIDPDFQKKTPQRNYRTSQLLGLILSIKNNKIYLC